MATILILWNVAENVCVPIHFVLFTVVMSTWLVTHLTI